MKSSDFLFFGADYEPVSIVLEAKELDIEPLELAAGILSGPSRTEIYTPDFTELKQKAWELRDPFLTRGEY